MLTRRRGWQPAAAKTHPKKKKEKNSLKLLRSLHSIPVTFTILGLKAAEDLGDAGDDVLLLLGGEAVLHVLEHSVERGHVGRAQVQDHDQLALGQVVRPQPPHQPRYRVRRVERRPLSRRRVRLAQRARERLEVLQELAEVSGVANFN